MYGVKCQQLEKGTKSMEVNFNDKNIYTQTYKWRRNCGIDIRNNYIALSAIVIKSSNLFSRLKQTIA